MIQNPRVGLVDVLRDMAVAVEGMELLTVIRMLPELIGCPARTLVGLSNLTSGRGPKEKKRLLEAVYLPMLVSAGLDGVLMDIFHQHTVAVARACDAITRQGTFSWAAAA